MGNAATADEKITGEDLSALTEAYRQLRDAKDPRAPRVAAVIQNIVQTGAHEPMNPANPDHAGFFKNAAADLWGAAKGFPAMFETPGINPGTGELTPGNAGRAQQNVVSAVQSDQGRKARGEGVPYRVTAAAATLANTNVEGMEQSAREGDVPGVLGHTVTPLALATAPLAAEGLGRVARMPAIDDLVQAKANAIRDAGTKTVRTTTGAINTALQKAPGAVGGTVGGATGATIGHAIGGPYGAAIGEQIGQNAGTAIGRSVLPKVKVPGERFGLPDRVEGGEANVPARAQPVTLSELNGTKPQITPKAVEQQISASLGGAPLEKNVPLRQQLPALKKNAAPTASTLPEGFTPALRPDGTPSSALRGYKYDPATREFESISKDGSHYIHGDVSPEEVEAFEQSPSKGQAWNQLMDQNVRVAKVINGKRIANMKARPTGEPTEEAPGGVIQNQDLTPSLSESLRNIQNLPKDPSGKPIRYVYRARDVGEEGIPLSNTHASATSDAKQAIKYAQPGQRGEAAGQVVRIDLSKLSPKDYVVKQHPDGMAWVQFTRPLTEAEVKHYAGAAQDAGKK